MPVGWLRAYAAMLPRLRDEEMLQEITAVMAGNGTMDGDDRAALVARLHASAMGEQPRRRRRKPLDLAALAAMGIQVTETPVG